MKRITFGFIVGCLLIFGASAIAGDGENYWQNYQQAASLFKQDGSPDKIIDLCEEIAEKAQDPTLRLRAELLIAQVYIRTSDFSGAHKAYNKIYNAKEIQLKNIANEARLADASLYFREGNLENARFIITPLTEQKSNSIIKNEAYLLLAGTYAALHKWVDSDSVLAQLLDTSPQYQDDERVRVLAARQALSLNNPQKAIEQLQGKQSKEALLLLAKAYEMAENPIMSVGVYKKLRDQFSHTEAAEFAMYQSGEVFMNAKDWIAARSEFTKLLESYPQTKRKLKVKFRLGWIAMQLGDYNEALQAYSYSDLSDPIIKSYFEYMRGECLRRMGAQLPEKRQEAVMAYNSLVALSPHSPVAPLAKLKAALTLFEKGDSTDAIINLRQFLSLYPKHDLAATSTYFLATRGDLSTRHVYNEQLIEKYPNSKLFQTALVALLERDYKKQNYQEMIHRQTHFSRESEQITYWQRAQHLLIAEAAYYLKQYDQAYEVYVAAADVADDEIAQSAWLGKAWCVLQTGHVDSARAQFAGLQERLSGENYLRSTFGLATTYYRNQEYEQALRTYPTNLEAADAAALSPLVAKSLFRSGDCYFRLEYYGQAIETWQKLVTKFPHDENAPQAQFKVADTYFRANHFDEAAAAFQKLIADYGSSEYATESMLQLAQCYYNAGNYNEAIKGYEDFIAKYPKHTRSKDALEGIQLSYYQLGQGEQASEALQKVIEKFPSGVLSADARYRLASAHLQARHYDEAITAFKEILTQYPGTTYAEDAQYDLATAYQAKGDFDSANAEFARFIQYFPDSPNIAEATFQLAAGYFNLESYLSASDYFSQIVEKYPNSDFYKPALQNLGWCFKRLGEQSRALNYFKTYLDKNPQAEDRENVILQIASIQIEAGQKTDALPTLNKLLQSGNGEIVAEAAFQKGMLLLADKNGEEARKAFNLSVKKGSQDNYYRLSSLAQLGALYEGRRDWRRAIAAYQLLADNATDQSWVAAAQERIQALTSLISAE